MSKQNGLDAKSFSKALYVFIVVAIVITVLVSVYFTIILNKMSMDLSNSKYVATNNNEKIEALTKLKEDYKNVSFERERIEAYIPEQKEASNIIKDLEVLAQKNGLSFVVYKIDATKSKKAADAKSVTDDPQIKKGDDYNIFTFEVELKGSYAMVDKMISGIEGHDRLLEITKISYKPPSANETEAAGDDTKATLLVNAYLKK